MKKKFYSILSIAMLSAGALMAQTSTFNFTGGIQTFTVPCGVTSVFVQTWGAQGGSGALGGNSVAGGTGGLGGYSEGFLAVAPGDVLNVFVGGQGATPAGGFNGGANGGTQNAGGGGGATDVRANGTAEANRVITAGGGGGGGRGGCHEGSGVGGVGGNGGFGGGGVGVNGNDSPQSSGVAGGGFGGNSGSVQGALGAAGIGCSGFLGAPGTTATTGTGGNGGAGQTCCCSSSNSIVGGGGGGGGQLGGGGGGGGSAGTTGCAGNSKGAGGGGGGGSSFIGGVTSGVVNNGIWLGNGQVTISWTAPVPTATTISGPLALCVGSSATFTASTSSNATTYNWTVPSTLTITSGQGTQTLVVTGVIAGTDTITCEPVNATCSLNGPIANYLVVVNALPNVVASANPTAICAGDTATLVASGASSYVWNTADTSASIIVSPSTSMMYTATGTDANGCVNTDTTFVTVNQLPVVTLSLPGGIVCAADADFALTGGSPAGGTYSGSFVTAGNFSPVTAGAGSSIVTYMYTDSLTGCMSSNIDTMVVDVCTGVIGSNNTLGVVLMPNPTAEVLNVTWNANKASVNTLEVFDNTGRLVMTQVVNGGNQAALDVTSLPAGNYSLKVSSSNVNSQSFSFMKK